MQNLGNKLHKRYANEKCRFRKAESIFTLLLKLIEDRTPVLDN